MFRAAVLVLLGLFSALNSSCSPKITPQEAKVLVALDEIQRGVEEKIEYNQFVQLLETAEAELDTLPRHSVGLGPLLAVAVF